MEKVVLMNSPIVTGWGMYNWTPLNMWETQEILRPGFVSAIGDESTARFLSALLDLEVPVNRIQVQMGEGKEEFSDAVVLRLKARLPEGKVLSIEEMEQVEFDLGLLEYEGLKVVLMNSPIVTGWGMYNWTPLDVWETQKILSPGFVSAIGDESTARFLSALLDLKVPVNRIQVQMGEGKEEFSDAVVLRLKARLPEGKVLSIEEMEQVEFDLGLLKYEGL